ncbi:hypothetical protein Dsin_033040, partial [Dipteronia sinensis]
MGQMGVGDTGAGHQREALARHLLDAGGGRGGPRRCFLLLTQTRVVGPSQLSNDGAGWKLSNDMSPQSVQRVASDAGMAVDALMVVKKLPENKKEAEESGGAHSGFEPEVWGDNDQSFGAWTRGEKELSISVDDYLT